MDDVAPEGPTEELEETAKQEVLGTSSARSTVAGGSLIVVGAAFAIFAVL